MTTTEMVNEVMWRRGGEHPYTPSQLLGALREMFAFTIDDFGELLGGPSREQVLARSLEPDAAWFTRDAEGNYVFDDEKRGTVLVKTFWPE